MRLCPGFTVLEPLRRNNPSFSLQVDFGPFGANHFAGPETCQQRDFKSFGSDTLPLVYCREELRRWLVIKRCLPATGELADALKPTVPQISPISRITRHRDAMPVP